MAGLLDIQIDEQNPLASLRGFEPETPEIDEQKETISGQLNALLSRESPYIARARTSAAEVANQRGLLNSSIAAGAGEAAAIEAALPIAAGNAQIFNERRLANQQARNRALEFTAGSANQAALAAFGANRDVGLQELVGGQALQQIGARGDVESRLLAQRAEIDRQLQELVGSQALQQIGARGDVESLLLAQRAEIDRQLQELVGSQALQQIEARGALENALQQLRGNQAETLAQIEASYRTLIQTSASAAALYADSIKVMTAVMADPNLTQQQQQDAINRSTQLLQIGLNLIGTMGNVDVSGLIDFSGLQTQENATPQPDNTNNTNEQPPEEDKNFGSGGD